MIYETLSYLFPNWGMIGFALAWVAFAMIASLLSNHQEWRNKKLNILKVLAFATFLISWTVLSSYYRNGEWRESYWSVAIIAYCGAALYILGDLLAFAFHQFWQKPGGFRGMVWRGIVWQAERVREFAANEARQSLRPHEHKIIELQRKEAEQEITQPDPITVAISTPTEPAAVLGELKRT